MTPDLTAFANALTDTADIVLQAGPPSGGGGPSPPDLPSDVPDGVQNVVDTALSAPGEVASAALEGVANAADTAIKAVAGVLPR